MAGAGWRDFVPGEVLTAANVQDYLQDQAVMVFASAAARTSALTSPSEGMMSYRTDSNIVEVYDGSAWKQFGKTTDSILQVVTSTSTTSTTTSAGTFQSCNLTATITPSATSSKVLVIASTGMGFDTRATTAFVTLFRGTTAGTDLSTSGGVGFLSLYPPAAATMWTNVTLHALDSPATTSATTYTLAMKLNNAGSGNVVAQAGSSTGVMTLMEVAG